MRDAMTTLWLFGNHAVTAAVVLGLFWAAASRPSRIRRPNTFRLSALLIGASFVANVAIPLVLIVNTPEDDRGRAQGPRALLYLLVIPPALVMLAIYLGIVSVMEHHRPDSGPGTPPNPAG